MDGSEGMNARGAAPLVLRVLMIIGFVIALAATVLVVIADDVRLLRLGAVLALWAALVAAFAVSRSRRDVKTAVLRQSEAQLAYELELQREVSARQEYETYLTETMATAQSEQIAELREQLDRLTAVLASLADGELLVSRLTVSAESARFRSGGQLESEGPALIDTGPRGLSAGIYDGPATAAEIVEVPEDAAVIEPEQLTDVELARDTEYLPEPEPVAEPEPVVEPAPIPEPVADPEPVVEPTPIPEPVADPEPVVEPTPIPEPVAEPEPVVQPPPIFIPEPEPAWPSVPPAARIAEPVAEAPARRSRHSLADDESAPVPAPPIDLSKPPAWLTGPVAAQPPSAPAPEPAATPPPVDYPPQEDPARSSLAPPTSVDELLAAYGLTGGGRRRRGE